MAEPHPRHTVVALSVEQQLESRLEEQQQKWEERLEEQRESIEEMALETVNAVLANLRLPTLKQALEDLGLPVTGGKCELTARLTDQLTLGIVSGRRE